MRNRDEALELRVQDAVARCSDAAVSLWAKSGDESGWLCLPQHMVDSACVAGRLWNEWIPERLKGVLARAIGLSVEEAGKVVMWLAAAHDIGKATLKFQLQLETRPGYSAFADRIADAGLPLDMGVFERGAQSFKHSVASEVIQTEYLKNLGLKPSRARRLAGVAGAHHGIASSASVRLNAGDVLLEMAQPWRDVQAELLDMVTDLCEVRDLLPKVAMLNASSTEVLAGTVVMADWIASNEQAFPMIENPRLAVDQAHRVTAGMAAISITAPWDVPQWESSSPEEFYGGVFGWGDGVRLRQAQLLSVSAANDAEGPTLLIVEAPTGSGKTEAALAAAQILAAKSEGEQGVIFAAPTMATANGLFERVEAWASRNTVSGQVSSMYLAHSKRELSEQFRALRVSDVNEDADSGGALEGEADSGHLVATQWLSGRKRGLLANFVVATVDQVLMLALQMRHSMLRHLGLAGKIVIIDEAHAYDWFMSEYLMTTLRWLSRYGVSVIVMSATLPLEQKRRIAAAYLEVADYKELPELENSYPMITSVGAGGIKQYPGEIGSEEVRVGLEIIDDSVHTLVELIQDATSGGGCVLVLCNTVRRAQEAFRVLSDAVEGPVELHHSAFTASHRARKEDELVDKLGPNSHRGCGRPDSLVVVATQVAEQSLDIDVDMLITDIAPMDLLVQRMGRLHRHDRPETDRPEKMRQAKAFIRGIEKRSPIPEWEGGTAAIYDKSILGATLAVLERDYLANGWSRPSDIAPAVHSVYRENPDIPADWKEAFRSWQMESEEYRAGQGMRASTFRIPDPLHAAELDSLFTTMLADRHVNSQGRSVLRSEEAVVAQVRDTEPVLEVIPIIGDGEQFRCLQWSGNCSRDIFERLSYHEAFDLASDTVRLPTVFSRTDRMFSATIEQLERSTPPSWQEDFLLKGQVALLLDEKGEATLAGRQLRYTEECGLEQVVVKDSLHM